MADFVGSTDNDGIPYRLMDYLELVDWTGRAVRDNVECLILNDELESKKKKRRLCTKGYISDKEPKILEKLGFTADVWLKSVNQFSEHTYSHIGTEEQLKAVCEDSGKKWIAGIVQSKVYN